ncbi:MAG: UDP-N-acetylglucosamine 4,6-dehydratase [Oceanospirillaceae bacterium]|nr:UDP-N-acetylglucosamine 4,6-dehydratase [Oceanospirillaceae bacterium]
MPKELDPVLNLIGRKRPLFSNDLVVHDEMLCDLVQKARFLVIGAAGTIGSAVTIEIAKRSPCTLHLVDISENNLVELVRDLRSGETILPDDFKALALDVGSIEYDAFIESDGKYDYVLNLSALKHVRSEKDPYTLMRMIDVNIFNTEKTITQSINKGVKKYFCVSTDKAANPVNLMGASKRIMELFLVKSSQLINISTARFANVAFSDGSLLYGFEKRLEKFQPLVAPNDVKRYFVTKQESGLLCLFSCLLGKNSEIFFPKPNDDIQLVSFSDIAERFLIEKGLKVDLCSSEIEAKNRMFAREKDMWPCLFIESDTTGEKKFEEFYTADEEIDLNRFDNLGIVKLRNSIDEKKLNSFKNSIENYKKNGAWKKEYLVDEFFKLIPDLDYVDIGKYLDSKM